MNNILNTASALYYLNDRKAKFLQADPKNFKPLASPCILQIRKF